MNASLRAIALTLSRQVVSALIQFVTMLVIARSLGPAGNGVYQMAMYLPAMLMVLANPGISASVAFHVARTGDDAAVFRSALSLMVIAAMVGGACGAVVIVAGDEYLFPGVSSGYLWLALASFPVTMAAGAAQAVLQGREDFRSYNAAIIAAQAATLALVLWRFAAGGGVVDVLYCVLAGNGAGLLLAVLFMGTRWVRVAGSPALARDMFRYGAKAYAANLVAFINYRVDLFIVNLFLGPMQVGIYVVAVRIAEYLWLLSTAVSTIVFPRLSSQALSSGERRELIVVSFRMTLLVTAAGGVALAAMAVLLVDLALGPAYAAAVAPLWILVPGIVLFGASRIISNALAAAGRPEINAWIATAICVFNVLLSLALVPRFGIAGAALATSVCYGVDFIVKVALIARMERVDMAAFLPRRADFALLLPGAAGGTGKDRAAGGGE